MKFNLISALILLTIFDLAAQELSEKEMIGFGCWFSGRPTKYVEEGLQLLTSDDLDGLRKNLKKNNAARQYFATVTLVKLDSAETINLTSDELEQITEIHRSNRKIAFCSGCTVFYESTLAAALNRDSEIYKVSNFWINKALAELNYCKK